MRELTLARKYKKRVVPVRIKDHEPVDLGGLERDHEQARRWYEKAAAGGNTGAMMRLSRFYESGLGVERDRLKARQWNQKVRDAERATQSICALRTQPAGE